MKFASIKKLPAVVFAGFCLAMSALAPAAVIENFETYTNSTGGPGTFTNPLAGQNGGSGAAWTASTSTGSGRVYSTATSGLYLAGKAVSGDSTSNFPVTYIGGRATGSPVLNNAFTFDIQVAAGEGGVGGWADSNSDGLYPSNNSEAGFVVGTQRNTNATTYFGIRDAGFGGTNNNDTIISGTGTTSNVNGRIMATGYTPVIGDWYRVQTTISGSTVTLVVLDLTTNTFVDFDTVAGGRQDFSVTLASASFGTSVANYTGIVIRSTGLAAIDNIQSGAALPEPTSLGSLSLAGAWMLARKRAKKQS